MLVLSRKVTERVCIGNDVFITILGIKGDKVRLGVTAPKHVAVDREEVLKAKLAELQETKKD
jgi:carbon storage regulator